MANPAELLHDLFVEWNDEKRPARSARNDDSLVAHRRAIKHLEEIKELVGILESLGKRVSVYKRHHHIWVKTVFNYPSNWQGTSTAKISQTAIDHLDTLAGQLDGVVPSADENKLESLEKYLQTALQRLDEDGSLSPTTRLHAQAVTNHVLACINDLNKVGEFRLEKALEQFLAVLFRVMGETQSKEGWQTFVENFVWPFTVSTGAALPGTLLTQFALGG